MNEQLDGLRGEIDCVDRKMTELFEQRMNLSQKIAQAKASWQEIYNPERERIVISGAGDRVAPGLRRSAESFFAAITRLSRCVQYSYFAEGDVSSEKYFDNVTEKGKAKICVSFKLRTGGQGIGAVLSGIEDFGFEIASVRSDNTDEDKDSMIYHVSFFANDARLAGASLMRLENETDGFSIKCVNK